MILSYSNLNKPFRLAIACGILFLASSSYLQAQIASIEENSKDLKVKYLEGDNNELLFNVKYSNGTGNDFKVMVLGEEGEVLFQKNYSGKKFKKLFRLPRLTDTDGVTFVIRPVKSNTQLTYRVHVPNKVEEIVEEDN